MLSYMCEPLFCEWADCKALPTTRFMVYDSGRHVEKYAYCAYHTAQRANAINTVNEMGVAQKEPDCSACGGPCIGDDGA